MTTSGGCPEYSPCYPVLGTYRCATGCARDGGTIFGPDAGVAPQQLCEGDR